MLKSFLRRRATSRAPAPRVPDDVRAYAIGDIHGRDDLFVDLLAQIDADHRARAPKRRVIVLLGDLVDRGPESAQVVGRAMALAHSGEEVRILKGNHEELFLLACHGDREALRVFGRVGGRETALSYGIAEAEYLNADFDELAELLRRRVPPQHLDFLSATEKMVVLGDYAFVHAGIQPGVPLDQQRGSDLRWIRTEFLNHRGAHSHFIVHGHTITEAVDEQPNRLGIDTGAYDSGRLTAVALEGDQRWFLATG